MSREVPTPPTPDKSTEAEQQTKTDVPAELLTLNGLIEHLGNGLGQHADMDETLRAVSLYLAGQQGRSPLDQYEEECTRRQILAHDLESLTVELDF